MAEKGTDNPTTGTQADVSKAQSQQQPPSQASQQRPETGERRGEFERNEAERGQPDQGQGDILSEQRTDIEGSSLASGEKGEAESGFVGSQGQKDRSSELIEDEDQEFAKGGQGAPEGK